MSKVNRINLPSVGMPNGDCEAQLWLQNFANQIVEDRTIRQLAYVTDEQVDRVVTTVAAFDEAYLTANCGHTRTKPNIELKDLARNAAVIAAREVANLIKNSPRVTTNQLYNLGMDTVAKKRDGGR